jgi:hypothetical protein
MPIKGGTILNTVTSFAPTGGTSVTLSTTGQTIANGVQVADMAVADFRVRPTITFKNRVATLQADGTWSKSKLDYTIVVPKVLASGKMAFPVARGSLECHPEMTAAEVTKLIQWSCQIWYDADFAAFLTTGAVD